MYTTGGYILAYVEGRKKLMRIETDGTELWLLFDLDADPEERTSLHAVNPATLQRMKSAMQDVLARHRGSAWEAGVRALPEDERDRLRALGYLED